MAKGDDRDIDREKVERELDKDKKRAEKELPPPKKDG